MSAEVRVASDAPQFGAPRALFMMNAIDYNISPDGHVVFVARANDASRDPIHIVVNWTRER